jgi:hypothetical protein
MLIPRASGNPGAVQRVRRAMLVELSVMEQCHRAVMEVASRAPVTEVARRVGVPRQALHGRLGSDERDGLTGLAAR